MKYTIKIECDDKNLAKEFMSFMDGQGEQDFWTWLECQEPPMNCDITYDYKKNIITMTKKGRLIC